MLTKVRDLALVNVNVQLLRGNNCIERRTGHNVLTNNGRTWLRNLVGASSYGSVAPSTGYVEGGSYVLSSERARYVGVGVGGALSASPYFRAQEETSDVTAIEDYVAVTSGVYLKQVLPQTAGNAAFPDSYTLRLVANFAESEISFAGNTSKSGNVVGTSVPVSEAGLYISGAQHDENPDHADNTSRLVAYHIFSPITVTPNTVLRITWDLLF
jgi:hypothetical protein